MLRVLGPVEFDGAVLGPTARALLCRLVVASGRPVDGSALIGALWGDDAPRTAHKTLQGHVLRLRKALAASSSGAERIGIGFGPGGYVLSISDPMAVDLAQFDVLLAAADAARRKGDQGAAVTNLRAALGLWRGAPFGEFSDREWATIERRRLEERRAAGWEDLIDIELARGRHHSVIAELEPIVAAEPFRERAWEQLALALYRCSRQADALRAIQRARTALTRELGVEPGPGLKQLERRILDQDGSLVLDVGEPEHATTSPPTNAAFARADMPDSRRPPDGCAEESRVAGGVASEQSDRRLVAPLGDFWQPGPGEDVDAGDEPPALKGVLPTSLAVHVADPWVGRAGPSEVLGDAWRAALAGRLTTVLIAGEPGVGKTAFAARFASEAARGGALVLHGHSVEDAPVPYGAFAEALEQLVVSASGRMLADHVRDHGSEICGVVPALARRLPELRLSAPTTPEADRGRLGAAISGILQAAAADQPIVIVFDDLHWVDAGTVGLLRDLVHRAPDVPLLLIGTHRTTDVGREQPAAQLFADLRREPGIIRIALGGLAAADVADLMRAVAGRPLDERAGQFADRLHRDTAGNPFFIIEVLKHLIESGGFEPNGDDASLHSGTPAIPEGIRDVVGRRLERLAPGTTEILRCAAVIGPQFRLAVLADVAGGSQEGVLTFLETARAAELVAEVPGEFDGWRFTHELVRRTLLDQLSASRRTRIHRTIGTVLETRRPHELTALAHHFTAAAGLGEVERSLRYAFAAADEAALNGAHRDAATLLERALDGAEAADDLDATRRIELLTRIGSEIAKAGDPTEAQRVLDRAADLARHNGAAELFARTVLATTSYGWSWTPRHGELIAEALSGDPLEMTTRARLLAARARRGAYLDEPTDRKHRHVAEAIAAARAVGDPFTLGAALIASLYVGFRPGDTATRQRAVDQLLAAAQAARRPDWEAVGWAFQTDCHVSLGDNDAEAVAHENLRRLERVSRDPFAALTTSQIDARRACVDGDFAGVESLAADQFDLGARIGMSQMAMEANASCILLPLCNWQRRFDQIETMLLGMSDYGEFRQAISLWTASLRARQGRLDEAEAALGSGMPTIDLDHYWGWSVDEATTAVVHLDDPVRAGALLGQLQPYRHLDCTFDWLQHRGAVIHHTGRLLIVSGRFTEAVDALTQAIDRYQRLHSPPWLVVARHDLTRALRGRAGPGDHDNAARLEASLASEAARLGIPIH